MNHRHINMSMDYGTNILYKNISRDNLVTVFSHV